MCFAKCCGVFLRSVLVRVFRSVSECCGVSRSVSYCFGFAECCGVFFCGVFLSVSECRGELRSVLSIS